MVNASFDDADGVVAVVEALGAESVPADVIRVAVLDRDGSVVRRIPVSDEDGALRGAVWGAAAGALLGVLIVALSALGLIPPLRGSRAEPESISRLLGGIAILAAGGVPLGAIVGTGRWRGRRLLEPSDFRDGRVEVVVTSEALADTARRVFREHGGRVA